ncbi:BREX-1 system adenine-specific DNA-methyltransferase PglX [Bacillus mojavensis]|uniref:BREX-1 system adenine-specific DNA-methyltransferase PglX n=1 Tax=Bacillus mojavensis TaxID=72360 RepID=UPI002DB6796F|nr:BREX-1 system adenine-specific DNA-methyltransferase PglX [Bacillus mojavensis]MEC1738410.1 BREX-1 system adenine-specific DNA-methyltransferase PglX [Bacillus mojavensis]MEC1795242.1 BREX-1 system adenine-specific DNA-methyltransferase PglX [Bacillus mojavensis]
MKPEQKKAINRTILKCREMLEKDIENRLVTYGILMDEPWIEKDKLSLSDEQEQVYKDLRDAIAKEMKGGLSEKEALISYIREVTYTYLNRIAALRVMEVRGLMEEVLVQKEEYSNRSYGHRNFFEIAREFCKSQSDEGLSYFISLIFKEVSADIGLLFNIDDEYSIIGPSNHALVEIIRLLTTDIDEESWQQDEIIGWIYQYFNEEEKEKVFKNKKKFERLDIPPATQLFTPDWIVEWIINNSLGKAHRDMKSGENRGKSINEIKLLDPSCGSGHFLVKAFDLFYQYYIEDGYPKEEIPFLILKNNLYGIDIDARAIQLTALILYIKVRVSLKETGIKEITENIEMNLVVADAILLNGERLQKLKKQFEHNSTVLNMIDIIYEEFKDTRLRGSLIQPEKKLKPLMEEYIQQKKKELKKDIKQIDEHDLFAGMDYFEQEQNESVLTKSEKELFNYLEQIYTQAIQANDINNLLFANEARKSVRLLNTFMQKYEIVVTNPPYLGKQSMDEDLNNFLNNNYLDGSNDLYSAFILRCLDFVAENGFVGMITQNTFMFKPTFEGLRLRILDTCHVNEFVHLGPRAFDDISGEKVNTAMFVLQLSNKNARSLFINLTNYKNSKDKQKELFNSYTSGSNKFCVSQENFKLIKGAPFVYWMTDFDKNIFKSYLPLDNKSKDPIAFSRKGLTTGDDTKFVRFYWEVPHEKLGIEWKYLSKGKEYVRWYESFNRIVFWKNNGEAIKNFKNDKGKLRSVIRSANFYENSGMTYGMNSTNGFAGRILPEDVIISANGPGIFGNKLTTNYLLGLLNSEFGNRIFNLLAPLLTINISDVDKFPIKVPNQSIQKSIENLVEEIIPFAKYLESLDETKPDFSLPNLLIKKGKNLTNSYNLYKDYITLVHKVINSIESTIDNIIYDLYQVPDSLREYKFNNNYLDYASLAKDVLAAYSNSNSNLDLLNSLNSKMEISFKNFEESVFDLFSYFIGIIFGRWSINTNGTELSRNNGIIHLNHQFIEEDIFDLIESFFDEDSFEDIVEKELPNVFKKDIYEWFIKDFFTYHVSKYEKRPIYWHVCSPNKKFNALLYYHSLTSDTLYKLKNNHLKPMLDNSKEDLNFYREKMKTEEDKKLAKQFEKRVLELEKQVNDLEIFNKQIDEILATGYTPDIDQGVLYNITPLNPILAKKIEK